MTTVLNGVPVGLTCNSFSSVSLEPPLVLWSLRKESKSLDAFKNSGVFAINILAEDQNAISSRFASGKIADKFESVSWTEGLKGVPLIEQCIARFECSTFAQHEAGDHVIFIGRVERFDMGRVGDPLVYYKGAYMMLTESLRELATQGKIDRAQLVEGRTLLYGLLLKLACERGRPEDFDAMQALVDEMDDVVPETELPQRVEKSVQFLDLIAQSAHNDVLSMVAKSVSVMLRHSLNAQAMLKIIPELNAVRNDIVQKLRERDAEGATKAMNQYAAVSRSD